MAKKDKKVRVEILPLRGIGGVGDAGDRVWMTKEDADHWVSEGYVKILPDEASEPVPSSVADQEASEGEQLELADEPAEEEAHQIMKPQNKRD